MKTPSTSKQLAMILIVVIIGLVLAFLVLKTDAPQHEHEEAATENTTALPVDNHEHEKPRAELAKGAHGGKLFNQDGYGVEVTIFEQNVEPQFRVYTYQDGKPLPSAQSEIEIELERLGRPVQLLRLVPEEGYLQSDQIIVEPHSFKARIKAVHDGKRYAFAYEQAEAQVRMTERQLELNAIEILTAAPARIRSTLHLIGEIKLNADRTVHVVPGLSGIVQSVLVNAGEMVKTGQVLAVISSQSLADQRSELIASQKRLSLARITYEREKQLWEEKISAEQDYLQARQAMQEEEIAVQSARQKLAAIGGGLGSGSNLTRYEVRSPISGMVTDKQISTGQLIREDAGIFVVADLSTVWAETMVYANDINTIKAGQQVTVKASAFDAQSVGTVSYIGALVGEQSRTTVARVVLQNPKGLWRPGLPVNVELISEEVEVPLAVSLEGLQTLGDWNVVFGRYGDVLEARPLKLGRRDNKYAEVLDGLLPGEKYAARNSFLVKAELGKSSASHDH